MRQQPGHSGSDGAPDDQELLQHFEGLLSSVAGEIGRASLDPVVAELRGELDKISKSLRDAAARWEQWAKSVEQALATHQQRLGTQLNQQLDAVRQQVAATEQREVDAVAIIEQVRRHVEQGFDANRQNFEHAVRAFTERLQAQLQEVLQSFDTATHEAQTVAEELSAGAARAADTLRDARLIVEASIEEAAKHYQSHAATLGQQVEAARSVADEAVRLCEEARRAAEVDLRQGAKAREEARRLLGRIRETLAEALSAPLDALTQRVQEVESRFAELIAAQEVRFEGLVTSLLASVQELAQTAERRAAAQDRQLEILRRLVLDVHQRVWQPRGLELLLGRSTADTEPQTRRTDE